MLIANPIYDSVFKYLLEDLDIAKGFLSTILGNEIESLELKPQEVVAENKSLTTHLTVYRLDFKAVIKQSDGSYKNILIELQKTNRYTNIIRFRRYLAENYQKEDSIIDENGNQVIQALPIISIYILGFKLENISVPVLKVSNSFFDVIKNKTLLQKPKEPFVELLNHESYTIQIPRLDKVQQTKIEKILMIFNQSNQTEDRQKLSFNEKTDEPLLNKMLNRLNRAITEEDLRKVMDLEDEIEQTYVKDLSIKQAEYDQLVIKTEKKLQEKDKKIEEKDRKIEEMEKRMEALLKQIEANKK